MADRLEELRETPECGHCSTPMVFLQSVPAATEWHCARCNCTQSTEAACRISTHWDGCWRVHLECAVARIEALEGQLDQLGGLLAVIHGDGGHYIAEHGWQKAVNDAIDKWHVKASAERREGEAKELLAALEWEGNCNSLDVDECCPSCGQYRHEGHASFCLLAAALGKGEGK